MEDGHILLVPYKRAPKVFIILKLFIVIPLLLFSLTIYIIGLALTLTIVGAVIGIPFILSTYAFDIILIGYLINPMASFIRVSCPNCSKDKIIITDIMKNFICGGCRREVFIKNKTPSSRS